MSSLLLNTTLGPLLLVEEADQLTGLYFADRPHTPQRTTSDPHPLLTEAAQQVIEYLAGTRRDFDLPLAPHGSAFQHKVWLGLAHIPYGQTVSYGELAQKLGMPKAIRAVGTALGQNPLSLILPCHRVVGKSGRLTGYAGGLTRKAQLLQGEQREVLLPLSA